MANNEVLIVDNFAKFLTSFPLFLGKVLLLRVIVHCGMRKQLLLSINQFDSSILRVLMLSDDKY